MQDIVCDVVYDAAPPDAGWGGLLFCQDDLAGVEGEVVGAAEHDGEAIAGGILGEVLVGDGGVFAEPVLRREALQGGGELAVDLAPGLAQIGGRDGITQGFVGVGDEGFVEFGMQALADEEHGKQAVVDRGEVAEEVEDAIFAGSDVALELFVGEGGEAFVELAEDLVPRLERGVREEFFVGHVFSLKALFGCGGNERDAKLCPRLSGPRVVLASGRRVCGFTLRYSARGNSQPGVPKFLHPVLLRRAYTQVKAGCTTWEPVSCRS